MRAGFLIFLFAVSIFAKEKDSFITEQEYAQHLYKNPRGIGCDKCHGVKGEGMIIATYKEEGKLKSIKTQEINTLDFKTFKAALQDKRGVMPKYFLTSQEIKSLYDFLHTK